MHLVCDMYMAIIIAINIYLAKSKINQPVLINLFSGGTICRYYGTKDCLKLKSTRYDIAFKKDLYIIPHN